MVCAEEGLVDRLGGHFVRQRAMYEGELQRLNASLGLGQNDHCALLLPAAKGDLEAQRHLTLFCAVKANRDIADTSGAYSPSLVPSLIEAVLFARLAAVQGEEHDRTMLVYLLSLAAVFSGDADYAAEALAWIELAAEQGDELADQAMAREVGNEPPAVLTAAKDIHAAFVRHGVGVSREGVS